MEAKVQKWGNSLALRIPMAFARQIGLVKDGLVQIDLEGDRIFIRAVSSHEFRLSDALMKVTPENMHASEDFGDPVGGEAW
ncbi:MAG TPA: AbrB/MazE/SpoVT family DNA-binding domain-containing protein [Myxococcota bacterium]|nr:AbrB/MazE/SpoVT family DNA-binding domain-containing protein [Myxococcota bacterium]